MRILAPVAVFLFAACVTAGCSLAQQLTNGGGGGGGAAASDAGHDADADAGVNGAGCGIDSTSGAQLCVATTLCPSVVVDTQAFPHCGFRIKAGASELVCGCGESICSMGPFTTCAQAASLLSSQTEGSVCAQVANGGCTIGSPGSSSSGASGSGGGPTCDHKCLQECGSGAGCASVCGCR